MTRFFVRHPVATWMLSLAFIVTGIYAFPKLKIEAIPDVNLPKLTITTQWNGASPQAIQRSITLPIEEAVRNVHGVEELKSTSRPGQSIVEISYLRGTDIDFARLELNEQLGAVRRELPLNAGEPQVVPFVPEEFDTEDFFTFSIESPLSTNELRELSERWILPQVLAVEGVADARVMGGARPLVRVILDRKRLELYGIVADEIFAAIDELDELSGAGVVREGELEKLLAIRDPVDLRRLEHTVVARRGGRSFTLAMLGHAEPGYEDPDYFVRANGNNVVQIAADKRSGANTIGTSRNIREVLPRIEANLPFQATFHIDEDEGDDLREKLIELVLRSLAILAILFFLLGITMGRVRIRRATIAVLLFALAAGAGVKLLWDVPLTAINVGGFALFMAVVFVLSAETPQNLLRTSIVLGSILFAIIISLSLFYFCRISVNFITISGLTVCFGMILDNSILIFDSLHRRLHVMERAEAAGFSRAAKTRIASETVIASTGEVAFPILATTMTTLVAFMSFIFLSGRLALYYVPLAVSVATANIASLFVAFGWLPVVLNQTWASVMARKSSEGSREADSQEIEELVEDRADLESRPPFLDRVVMGMQRLWWIFLPPGLAVILWAGIFPIPETTPWFRLSWSNPAEALADSASVDSLSASLLEAESDTLASLRIPFGSDLVVERDTLGVRTLLDEKVPWLPYEFVGYVYEKKVIKGGFWRFPDEQELFLYLEMPAGTDIRVTSETLMRFEQAVLPLPEGARMQATTIDNRAFIRLTFEEKLLETESPTFCRLTMEAEADKTGGSSIFIRGFADSPYIKGAFSGTAVNSLIKVSGYNSRRLASITDETLRRMARDRRVRNPRVTSGERFDRAFLEETVIQIDREALVEHDLSVIEVVGYLRRLLGVDTPWTMILGGEEERVLLAFDDSETIEFADVAGRTLTAPNGDRVKLGDIVRMETVPVKGSVIREDQRYTMYVSWEYVGTDKMRRAYIQSVLNGLDLPYGYAAEEARQEFFTEEEEKELTLMAVLAAAFIFMIMAALFESISLPLLVLLSLPMSLVGVFIIFWLRDATFDSSARIGLVLLFGIVVNNAILLVSRFRTEASLILRAKLGRAPEEKRALFPGFRSRLGGSDLVLLPASERAGLLRRAVARGTRIRMRSILLTSLTTIVGLLPLLIEVRDTEGTDIWENLALSSIGGLISSTVLILLMVPPLYYAGIRFRWWWETVEAWARRVLLRKPATEPMPVSAPTEA